MIEHQIQSIPKKFADEVIFKVNGYTAQLCCSQESKDIAYRLRYRSYIDADSINPNQEESLSDSNDQQFNSRTHLIWYQGQAIASVRSSIWSARYDWSLTESVKAFWYEIHQNIGLQKNILESCRFVVNPDFKGRQSLHAQLLLYRIQDLSSEYDDCFDIITTVKEGHARFYKRMLGFDKISESISIPWIKANVVCLRSNTDQSRNIISQKGMPLCTEEERERYAQLCQQLNTN